MSTEQGAPKDIFHDPDIDIPASMIDGIILDRHPEFIPHRENLRCLTRLKMIKTLFETSDIPGSDDPDFIDQLMDPASRELVIRQIVDAMKRFYPN